jgi:lambda repressor-like predicted transcriptional regulator
MILPYDPLREAILLELNRAICARRAQGVSFDALEQEYGLSEEAMRLILRRNDRSLEKRVAKARLSHRPKARVI